MNAFEIKQFNVLRVLLDSSRSQGMPERNPQEGEAKTGSHADAAHDSSFDFTPAEKPAPPSTSSAYRFERNSAESINTRFVAEEHSNTNWQFNAGGLPGQDATPPVRRSRSSGRLGRSPPKGRPSLRNGPTVIVLDDSDNEAPHSGFDAQEWTQKIGSEHFAPKPPPQASVSPSRPMRPAKKPKPALRTAGTAGMVPEDTTSSSDDKSRPTTEAESAEEGTNSPTAMDIDPPLGAPGVARQTNGARTIPVEPFRPDWRAGDGNGIKPDGPPGFARQQPTFSTSNAGGSEDTDDFRTGFSEFRNVAPFSDAPTGLSSLSDLHSTLPFESQASTRIPAQRTTSRQSIKFPKPPIAPRPPPSLAIPSLKATATAWANYCRDFERYLQNWAAFNSLYVDHFAARRSNIEKQRRDGGFEWLTTRSDAGIREYVSWLEQDKEVRATWDVAAKDHEQRIREFMSHRDKMMK